MERAANQQKATISGLKTRTIDLTQSNKNDEQLVELLHLKEELLDEKDREALEMKERITKLETDNEASERLHASQERSTSTMRAKIKRLMKVEAKCLNILDTHYGGNIEKMNAYMRTNLISAECSDTLVQRWNAINTFRLDEESMFLLTKLLSSQRIFKSRDMLIDFLKTTLDFEIVHENTNEETLTMAPKKKDPNHHQFLRTPENPKKLRSKPKPLTFEESYKQHLSIKRPQTKMVIMIGTSTHIL